MRPWATGGLCSRWGQQGAQSCPAPAPSHEVLGLRQESPHFNPASSCRPNLQLLPPDLQAGARQQRRGIFFLNPEFYSLLISLLFSFTSKWFNKLLQSSPQAPRQWPQLTSQVLTVLTLHAIN